MPSPELRRLHQLAEEMVEPELYARLIESLPDALVVVNEQGMVVIFNEQAELLLGYHRSEIIGGSVDALVPDALRERHAAHRASYATDPRARPMGIGLQLSARQKSGEEIPVEINLKPIPTTHGIFTSAIIRRKR